ncbi:MAG: exodeoxyribonuclease III [Lachnospiraceae bacterium]
MKLISWNVNGLRACVTKGFLDFFKEIDADFFCLQETKLQEGQIELELEGYHQYWNYAEKKGYSGTAIFAKKEALSVRYGLGIPEHDREGRVITLEYDSFFLVTCYTPNSQNELARLPYRMEWEDAFRQYLLTLDEKKPVIVCGDLNVAHREIDLKNPKTNRNNAGFTDEEREKMTLLLESGFTDTFRYFYPDMEQIYSWWSYRFKAREKNAGWRIDYFLTSGRLDDKLVDARIHTDIMGSDHCPVELEIGIE